MVVAIGDTMPQRSAPGRIRPAASGISSAMSSRSLKEEKQVTMSKHLGRGAAALVAIVLVAGACSTGTGSSRRPAGPRRRAMPHPSAPSAGGEKPTLTFIAQIDNPSQAFSWKMYQKNAEKYGFNVDRLRQQGRRPAADHLHQRRGRPGRRRHRDQPRGRGGLRPRHDGGHGGRHRRVPEHGPARRGGDRRLHLLGERG